MQIGKQRILILFSLCLCLVQSLTIQDNKELAVDALLDTTSWADLTGEQDEILKKIMQQVNTPPATTSSAAPAAAGPEAPAAVPAAAATLKATTARRTTKKPTVTTSTTSTTTTTTEIPTTTAEVVKVEETTNFVDTRIVEETTTTTTTTTTTVDRGFLPEFMMGDYQLESSERYDEFLAELGVNWFVRQIVTRMKPIQKIRQSGRTVEIETVTAFTESSTKFELDVPYMDGVGKDAMSTHTFLEGDNKLIRFRSPSSDSSFTQDINEVREFEDNGNTMVLTLSIPDKEDAWTKRVFTKFFN